ncbi:MAG UNVERIFIED_CONTAM: hypothetical protein LVT10_13830 [Anaerolineae bacterium]
MARQQRTPTARQQLNDTQKREGASIKRENIAFLHNFGWYLRFQGAILRYGVLAAVALFTLYYLSHPLLGRMFPNVSTLGINIGGLSPERATDLLQRNGSPFNCRCTSMASDIAPFRPFNWGYNLMRCKRRSRQSV